MTPHLDTLRALRELGAVQVTFAGAELQSVTFALPAADASKAVTPTERVRDRRVALGAGSALSAYEESSR